MTATRFRLNAGTGTACGAVIAAVAALFINSITGEAAIWLWAIPVGVAVGAGAAHKARTPAVG